VINRDGAFWKQGSGRIESTTNQRAELIAAIRGLEAIPEGSSVLLTSDSTYVTKGISEWRASWKLGGWKGVANDDVWRRLDELVDARDVETNWVRGHAACEENNACDRMAREAYRGTR
jgi:ribonuclease HI